MLFRYACDIRVIRLLRDRTLGNSPARLVRQLKKNHGEEWLNRLAHYLGECADFVDRPSLNPVVCQEPPEPIDIPTSRWLLSIYGRDILSRIGHIKASITSIFGNILKMDSTKRAKNYLALLHSVMFINTVRYTLILLSLETLHHKCLQILHL